MNQQNSPSRTLDQTQFAAALGVARGTLRKMAADGRVPPPTRLGPRTLRWPADVVDQVLAATRGDR